MIELVLFIVGYLFAHAGNLILIRRILKERNTEGLAWETHFLLLISSLIKLVWFFETRLTSLVLSWIEIPFAVGTSSYLLFLFHRYRHSVFSKRKNLFDWRYLLCACAVLSFFFHPGEKNSYYLSEQMMVAISIYLECASLLPQLYIMRQEGQVHKSLGHYIIVICVSRAIRISFWIVMWYIGDSFWCLMVSDAIYILLVGDFIYNFIRFKNQLFIPYV